jgi:DNA-binding GntR family transcriptional regulator
LTWRGGRRHDERPHFLPHDAQPAGRRRDPGPDHDRAIGAWRPAQRDGARRRIRQSLECLAVREAAARLTAADFALLDSLLTRAPDAIAAADAQALHDLNEEFHQLFLARSENSWLQQMLGGLSDLLILARRQLTLERSGREAWAEHEQIVAALRAGDAAAAENAMAAHIGRVKGELLGQLGGEHGS